jgi:hypothetical protein
MKTFITRTVKLFLAITLLLFYANTAFANPASLRKSFIGKVLLVTPSLDQKTFKVSFTQGDQNQPTEVTVCATETCDGGAVMSLFRKGDLSPGVTLHVSLQRLSSPSVIPWVASASPTGANVVVYGKALGDARPRKNGITSFRIDELLFGNQQRRPIKGIFCVGTCSNFPLKGLPQNPKVKFGDTIVVTGKRLGLGRLFISTIKIESSITPTPQPTASAVATSTNSTPIASPTSVAISPTPVLTVTALPTMSPTATVAVATPTIKPSNTPVVVTSPTSVPTVAVSPTIAPTMIASMITFEAKLIKQSTLLTSFGTASFVISSDDKKGSLSISLKNVTSRISLVKLIKSDGSVLIDFSGLVRNVFSVVNGTWTSVLYTSIDFSQVHEELGKGTSQLVIGTVEVPVGEMKGTVKPLQ